MSLVTPDFTEIAEEIAAGEYRGIIKKGEVKEWPSGGQYVNWEIETVGDANPKNNGRRIFHKTSTGGKGAFMLQQIYKAAVGSALTGKFDTEQLVGKTVAITMVDGVRNGEPTGYVEVKRVKAVSASN